MSYPVVDQTTPIESIIALAQMGGCFKFRCLACGKVHYLDSKAWKRCSKNYPYSLRTTIRGRVAKVSITSNLGQGALIKLPELILRFPKIYSHKLALYDEEHAAMLLTRYARIYREISSINRPLLTFSNDIFVPLHIIVGWEKLRQFAYDYGILPENSPFQQYRRAILKCIEEYATFIKEHMELFTSHMPIPIKIIYNPSLSRKISVFKDDGKVLDFNKILDECQKRLGGKHQLKNVLREIVRPIIDFIDTYNQPPFALIKGFEYITADSFAYSIKPLRPFYPLLTCCFNVTEASLLYSDPADPINREDPITNYVLKTIEEIQLLFKDSIEGANIIACSISGGYS